MTLTQPVVGSVGWGADVNTNFQTLEDWVNALPPIPAAGDIPSHTGGYPGDHAGHIFTHYSFAEGATFIVIQASDGASNIWYVYMKLLGGESWQIGAALP